MKSLMIILMAIVAHKTLVLKSTAFENGKAIPSKYTCEGTNVNPELSIEDVPEEAKSLALVMDDPDSPSGTYDHWVMWNIPVTNKIAENSAPGIQGRNSRGENRYKGPCPPTGTGAHRYFFRIYALDTKLDLPLDADKNALLKAIDGHIIGMGELMGTYEKKA